MKKINNFFRAMFHKYKEVIAYLFFGACSMVANVVTYGLCYDILRFPNVASTMIAWLIAVLIAFFTNKKWVFHSDGNSFLLFVKEMGLFLLCRIITGAIDVGIMWLSVDHFGWNQYVWKIISNVVIIILNYIASKFWIFSKKKNVGS